LVRGFHPRPAPSTSTPPGGRAALSVFFFHAEDGIRGFHVTGVQTCALPILDFGDDPAVELEELDRWIVSEIQRIPPERRVLVTRSEERRGGEERRCGGARGQGTAKHGGRRKAAAGAAPEAARRSRTRGIPAA